LLAQRLRQGLIFGLAAIPTAAFSINFCAWIFGCGCRSWWSGAAMACNIHMQSGRHCPWCVDNGLGFRVAFSLILAVQIGTSFLSTRLTWKYRLALALAAFPLIGAAVAAIYGWVLHYWS
jgi:hypothetical protein